jgi:hypothetical protein
VILQMKPDLRQRRPEPAWPAGMLLPFGDHGRFRTQALSELSGFTLPAPAMRGEKWGDIHHGRLRRGGGSPQPGRSLRPPERDAEEQQHRDADNPEDDFHLRRHGVGWRFPQVDRKRLDSPSGNSPSRIFLGLDKELLLPFPDRELLLGHAASFRTHATDSRKMPCAGYSQYP